MTDPIQQQLIAARKNQILDSAAAVFAEKGFHPTTIRDIAKHAGIADGTIYNYFASKPALLLGIFERMRDRIMAEAAPPPADFDLRAFIRLFLFHPLMALKQDNFALFRVVVSEMLVNDELRALYYEQILQPALVIGEAFFQEHAGRTPEQTRLIIRAISGMILGLILEHTMGDPVLTDHWDQLPDVVTDLIINGLRGEAS